MEPPLGWLKGVQKIAKTFPERFDQYETLLTRNPIWLRRTEGVGYISPEDAIAYGLSGPSLRGSGVDWDIRKKQPYSSYEKFDFKVAPARKAMYTGVTWRASRKCASRCAS
jgi:NADH-quinone oxidoreductase subunit D